MITGTERTVYLIKKGIIDLLKVKSLKQITVNNICEQAMIGRSTFYNHYQDKYEVLEEMNKNFTEKLDGFLQERFLLEDIETILTALIVEFDHEAFSILIEIQEDQINLRQDLKKVIQQNFAAFFSKEALGESLDISFEFARELFAGIALTFIEYSLKKGEVEKNTVFLNKAQKMLFRGETI